MKTYTVTLTLTVKADNKLDASELAEGAAQHLMDTFNDDEMLVKVAYGHAQEAQQ